MYQKGLQAMYRYRDAGYYASAYGFGENGDCPAYVSGGGFVHLIYCSQYFKSGMVGRHWQGIVQPDEVGENHIECVAAH